MDSVLVFRQPVIDFGKPTESRFQLLVLLVQLYDLPLDINQLAVYFLDVSRG